MGKLDFTKMHGCGNDYVYIDCFKQDVEAPELLARTLSDRHKGVGGDGVILICPSETAAGCAETAYAVWRNICSATDMPRARRQM